MLISVCSVTQQILKFLLYEVKWLDCKDIEYSLPALKEFVDRQIGETNVSITMLTHLKIKLQFYVINKLCEGDLYQGKA